MTAVASEGILLVGRALVSFWSHSEYGRPQIKVEFWSRLSSEGAFFCVFFLLAQRCSTIRVIICWGPFIHSFYMFLPSGLGLI